MDVLGRFRQVPVIEIQTSEGTRSGNHTLDWVEPKNVTKVVKRHGVVDARVTFPATLHASKGRIEVLANGRLVGRLSAADVEKYGAVLQEFQRRGPRVQVPGQVVAGHRKMADYAVVVRLPTDPAKLAEWMPGPPVGPASGEVGSVEV